MAKKDEIAAKEAAEAAEREKAAKAGRDALAAQAAAEAGKSDKQREAEAAEAQKLAGERAAEDVAAAEAERKAAEKAVKGLPPNTRLLKAGTVLHLHGEEVELALDTPVMGAHLADEQHFASLLARDGRNLALNSQALRLVYSPMNGTPLPLASQRLKPEEMTEQERAVFGL
jgi:hypothetical protein